MSAVPSAMSSSLALTFDHRAIDGGYAARFLTAVKEIIETRDWTAEL